MTRRATIAVGIVLLALGAAALLTITCVLGVIAYMATMLGAVRVGVFLFACALVPVLALGYIGRVTHERLQKQRPITGRLSAADDALSRAAESVHHARRTISKHQAQQRQEYLDRA